MAPCGPPGSATVSPECNPIQLGHSSGRASEYNRGGSDVRVVSSLLIVKNLWCTPQCYLADRDALFRLQRNLKMITMFSGSRVQC